MDPIREVRRQADITHWQLADGTEVGMCLLSEAALEWVYVKRLREANASQTSCRPMREPGCGVNEIAL
jgi:hypothetical protein